MATVRRRFTLHRNNAWRRGIGFLLTFDEWLKIWADSGHLHESGKRRGQYCMARNGDAGEYKIGNVRIITVEQNHAELRHRLETKEKMRADRAGIKNANYRHGGRMRQCPPEMT